MLERRPLTIAQIAQRFQVSEFRVRGFVDMLEPIEQRGPRGAYLYNAHDVDTVGRRLRLGKYGAEARRILLPGSPESELDLQATALIAGGLDVVRRDTLLEALSNHDQPGMPIVVMRVPMAEQEWNVLETVSEGLYLTLIGRERDVPWGGVRLRCSVMEPDELRRLVSHAWKTVELRIEQVALKL